MQCKGEQVSKSNSFFKHFVIIGTGTALNMLLGLLTTPLITRIVDPAVYGQYSIFTMYSSLAVMVLCLGLDQALVRFYYESDKAEYKRALLFRCIKLPVIVSACLSVLFIYLVYIDIIKFEFNVIVTVFLCIYTITQLVYRFSLLLVRLAYQSKLYSFLNVLQKSAYILIALPLVILISKEHLLMLVIATTIASLVCMIVSIQAQKVVWNYLENDDSVCHISQKELLKYGYPFIISMGLTTVFQAIDKLSLNYYCTYTDVGIYSSTMTLVNVFAIIQTTFNALWAPMATEHYSHDKKDRTFYQNGNQVITVIMFFCGILLILCKDVFAILLGEEYREAAYILPCLVFHPIMYTISETTVTGIAFMKKSKMQILNAGVACLTNIIGNTFLVPIFGCRGAAISTGISYIVFFSMRTFVSNKYFYVDFKLLNIYILTVAVFIYALYNTFEPFNVGSVLGFAVCLIVLISLYKTTILKIINYIIIYKDKIVSKYI